MLIGSTIATTGLAESGMRELVVVSSGADSVFVREKDDPPRRPKSARVSRVVLGVWLVCKASAREALALLSAEVLHFPSRPALFSRCKFLTKTSALWRGGRAVPLTLGAHHMPFGPAGTAREPCAQNLVGVLDALRRAPRRGGREKGFG